MTAKGVAAIGGECVRKGAEVGRRVDTGGLTVDRAQRHLGPASLACEVVPQEPLWRLRERDRQRGVVGRLHAGRGGGGFEDRLGSGDGWRHDWPLSGPKSAFEQNTPPPPLQPE